MTVVETRPDATVSTSGLTITGAGGDYDLATRDDSDLTYVGFQDSGDTLVVGLAEPVIPAGAVVIQYRIWLRALKTSGGPPVTMDVTYTPDLSASATERIAITNTLFQTFAALIDGVDNLQPSNFRVTLSRASGGAEILVAEIIGQTVYVAKPVVVIDTPTGSPTLTTSNKANVAWTDTLDSDGGSQTHYEVRIYNAATYGAGGFDPATSWTDAIDGTPVALPLSTPPPIAGADTSWQGSIVLPDGTYRAYVRIAQTVNGDLHKSDWDFEQFTIDVDLPGVPTITATGEDDEGRIELELNATAGAATTDAFEVQRSVDSGVTWEHIRTVDGDGMVDHPGANPEIVYDFEAGNGQMVSYRARAIRDHGGGLVVASAWSSTSSDQWSSNQIWIKSLTNPELSLRMR